MIFMMSLLVNPRSEYSKQKHIHRHHRHPAEHGPTGVQPAGSASKLGLMGQFRAPWRHQLSSVQPVQAFGQDPALIYTNLSQSHLSVTQHLLGQVSLFFCKFVCLKYNLNFLTHLTIQISTKSLSTTLSVFKECAQPSGPSRWFGARAARCRQSQHDSLHGEMFACLPRCVFW